LEALRRMVLGPARYCVNSIRPCEDVVDVVGFVLLGGVWLVGWCGGLFSRFCRVQGTTLSWWFCPVRVCG
jgi:hypothetical protein